MDEPTYTKPQWVLDYEHACWKVWSPGELTQIGRKRRKRGYRIELNCETMRIEAWGPFNEGGWNWGSNPHTTVQFLDDWIEYGGETNFLDWMLGHLWCLIDIPREMPPFPEEFYRRPRDE